MQYADNHLDQDTVDQIRDSSRRSLHIKVKRVWNRNCVCERCKDVSVKNDKTISYICYKCGKYNSVNEAEKRYENGEGEYSPDNRAKIACPAFRGEKSDYSKLRDEYEIRAELYAKGKTRETMGPERFNRELKRELIHSKAYRGEKETGV